MTMLPCGSRAFDNTVGAAPAFAITTGETTLVALPGVPEELWWIWENSLSPLLDDLLGRGGYAEVTLTLEMHDESRIAYLLRLVQDEHEGVYVKSRANGTEDVIRVTLAGTAASVEEARDAVARAESDVRAALAAERIDVRPDDVI